MNLAQLQQELGPLEQQGAWAELLEHAQRLLPLVQARSAEEAWLLYASGKALVGLDQVAAALPPLQRSLLIHPAQSHAHYLLGFGLAAQGQWPAALAAQQRCCGLDPRFADAWYEQGRAALELGEELPAIAALERAVQLRPGWAGAEALLLAARVRQALRTSAAEAAGLIRSALATGEPPGWLLLEWCERAGAHLLADQLEAARLLLEALAQQPRSVAGCSHPFPRRLALFLLLLLAQLEVGSSEPQPALAAELRACLWLPPSSAEQQFWPRLVEPLLWRWLGRAPRAFAEAEAAGPRLLLDALPALEPAGLDSDALYRALAARLPERPAEGFLAFLPRLGPHSGDPASFAWWPALLQAARERLAQQPADALVRRLVDQHLQALSGAMLEVPNRLVTLPGQEAEALALREWAVASLVEASAALLSLDAQPPAPARQRPRRRWLLLATTDLPQCVLYRVEQKRQQLERLGCQVRLLWREQLDDWAHTPELLWADAVLVCRLAATHSVLRAMAAARRCGLPVLYDIDDLLFDPEHCPPAFATYAGGLRPAQHRRFALDVPLFAAAMEQADGVIVSTATLARRWQELHPSSRQPLWILPNLAPPDLLELASEPPPLDPSQPLRLVVASGTTAHKQVWHEELAPALAELLAANARLELELLGHLQLPQALLPFAERVRCRPYSAYPTYLRQLQRAQIGLVVLEPGTFTDAKSAIRWMEFSLLGLASVLSPTATYRELLEDGRHALFARGRQAWMQAIQLLIDDPQRRHQLAAEAHRHACAQFAPERADAFWAPLLAPDPPAPPAPRRRRLLVINVFFAPPSTGGATRVAQDQVRALLERAGDRYDVTVLCADQGAWQLPPDHDDPPLAVDSHGWHGARVVRLALPPRAWREHGDPAVADFCRRWFSDEGFDLIHAHCLQVLTAAPLQVAAELGIPYLVTLHDGWWLSPRLFLTTAAGRPIDPADPLGHYDDPSAQPSELLEADRERRRSLLQVLAGARARLAVSAPFAEVYRRAGVADVGVLENDWQPMAGRRQPPRRSARRASEPLRLCYVGGLALHKGFAVLQAALLRHRLAEAGAGATLTVIDASLQPDETLELQWNGTPVCFRPAVPMAAMAGFYAEHDVLLAPSIWPESYGLVTREALSAGLWVVASRAGALAEPIQHGRNGHAVPPTDADALGAVLLELCQQHPTPQPLLQFSGRASAIDQLLPLYDRFSS